MKKIILTLLLTICFISGVKAEEIDSCYNDYLINYEKGDYYERYNVSTDSWDVASWSNVSLIDNIRHLFPVENNKSYYIKHFTGQSFTSSRTYIYRINYYDIDKKFLNYSDTYYATSEGQQLIITIPNDSNIKYFSLTLNTSVFNIIGDTIAFADFDLSTCPIVEEPEPEVPEIIPDTTLTDFYTIYLYKLKNLSNYAMENKFILSAIGLILLFIVLEIILNLFNQGGARK